MKRLVDANADLTDAFTIVWGGGYDNRCLSLFDGTDSQSLVCGPGDNERDNTLNAIRRLVHLKADPALQKCIRSSQYT